MSDIEALFEATRERQDSVPYAHQAALEAAIAVYRPVPTRVSRRTLAAGLLGVLLMVSAVDGTGRQLGWW